MATLGVMATMNVSLPDALKQFVDRQVAEHGYGTSSEYVRELLRREQQRQSLRAVLLEGAASPVVREARGEYFAELRARAAGRPKRTRK
jgi:antitoxin ParD1/3/4